MSLSHWDTALTHRAITGCFAEVLHSFRPAILPLFVGMVELSIAPVSLTETAEFECCVGMLYMKKQ